VLFHQKCHQLTLDDQEPQWGVRVWGWAEFQSNPATGCGITN
jgi:hypothetical protein